MSESAKQVERPSNAAKYFGDEAKALRGALGSRKKDSPTNCMTNRLR